jgi:ribosomal protein S18 acetylase RimI-like enzyme
MNEIDIIQASSAEIECLLPGLARLIAACVEGGASVSFILPVTMADAEGYWRSKVAPAVQRDARVLFVAKDRAEVVGSVQLDLDMPPNQQHRAEVSKLLVHPAWRRRGIARRLMARLEAEAPARGRSLITLDTRTGDKAEPLYADLGYSVAGVIPGFARDPRDDRLDATTYMYKRL